MSPLEQYTQGLQITGADGGGHRLEIGAGGPRIRQSGGVMQRIMAGIPRTTIGASSSAEVPVTVSEPFRPEKLIFSPAAQVLDLNNLRIGTKSLNVTSNPLSGNCFSEKAVGSHVIGYTAQAGVGFVLSMANPTTSAVVLGGGCFGLALN
jgi:hypothetical protein